MPEKIIVEMQRVTDMIKYTFLFEYEGGTYIKQVKEVNLRKAMPIWAQLVVHDIPSFGVRRRRQLMNIIDVEGPVLLDGLENVWFAFFKLGRSSGFLNIVATL